METGFRLECFIFGVEPLCIYIPEIGTTGGAEIDGTFSAALTILMNLTNLTILIILTTSMILKIFDIS